MHLIRKNVLDFLFPTYDFTSSWHFSEYLNTLKESVIIQCVFLQLVLDTVATGSVVGATSKLYSTWCIWSFFIYTSLLETNHQL